MNSPAGRDLGGATIVLDSDGGSVNDAIALGCRWGQIGLYTTVGSFIAAQGNRISITPHASCDPSACSAAVWQGSVRAGRSTRPGPQIWMGDRTEDATASTYTDVMIVERDLGRLTKYTFDMRGTGDLLSLSPKVPVGKPA